MKLPAQITFRNMKHSTALEEHIQGLIQDLDSEFPNIMSCHVTVEAPHKHKQQGNLYQVSIQLRVPEMELVASKGNDQDQAHEDVHVAIRDAFSAIEKQLERYAEKLRGDVKAHSK